jgi:hypothetical protein
MGGCSSVSDLSPLRGCHALQILSLPACTGVTALPPRLGDWQILDITGCSSLSSLAPLAGAWHSLESLKVNHSFNSIHAVQLNH